MEKIDRKYYSWDDVQKCAHKLALEMYKNNFRPNYIVGLNRGGLPLSVILSHLLDCNHYTLDVRLRDKMRKQILVVDDINDTGATFDWIKQDWESGCLPDSIGWEDVWHENVRFATMCEKTHTNFGNVDYVWEEIDTSEKDTWIVFPWEYD